MSGIHLPYLLALPLGVVGMALQDAAGTFLVVAESRGNGKLAGAMDACGDLAGAFVTVAGAGSILIDGLTWRSVSVLAAIVATSYVGTRFWTGKADRLVKRAPKGLTLGRAPRAQRRRTP